MAKMDKTPSSRTRSVSSNVQSREVTGSTTPVIVKTTPSEPVIEKNFFLGLLSSRDTRSSKRFVTLTISAIFILTCITVLTLFIVLFISITRLQGINIAALEIVVGVLSDILKYEMIIIVFGLAFVTVGQREGFARILFAKGGDTTTTTTTTSPDTTIITDPTQTDSPDKPIEQIPK